MKAKILAFFAIAIVLCSLFLVAMPAIAAAQNAQKVSACTVTTANEDDFVLGIYGNANEDNTIDMRDLTYVKLIFFGERQETELADAKYDGEINPLDFVQIKLIIVSKENELTIVQYLGTPPELTEEPVTIKMPIERTVALSGYACEALCVFGLEDKIVGIDSYSKEMGEIAALIKDKAEVGSGLDPDIEKIISLEPDVVIGYTLLYWYVPEVYRMLKEQLSNAGIPLILIDFYVPDKYDDEFRVFGWLLHNEKRAEELISFEDRIHEQIRDVVSGIPESEKPRVCYSPHYAYQELEIYIAAAGTDGDRRIVENGGINIFADLEGYGSARVDSEAVIGKNPDIIIKDVYTGWGGFVVCGYNAESSNSLKEAMDLVSGRTGWEYISAVKNKDVYIICTHAASIHPSIFDSYIAKWLHPDRFEDLDPIEIHEEWLDEFLGMSYKGVYAYPTQWRQGT
ncbi:iron complex transport system substrate-binding protein [Methanophagales archaeon]|nr:iron complex transport system substrate-binding protein [Methanophagales archaeon]